MTSPDQYDVIMAIVEQAEASDGRSGHDILQGVADPYDELWTAIKIRVIRIMDKNADKNADKAADEPSLLPVATWLDGFATAQRLYRDTPS